MHFVLEALIVGIGLAILGTVIYYICAYISKIPSAVQWNIVGVVAASLFISGFLFHVLCEISGINSWYCKHGFACSQ